MVRNRHIAATVLCATLVGAGAPLAFSQASQAMQPPAQAQGAEVSDSSLELFTKAAQKLAEVQTQIQAEMQEAGSAEEAKQIQANSQTRMVEAVQSFGMTVEEYNRISTLAQSDPEVQKRLQEMMK